MSKALKPSPQRKIRRMTSRKQIVLDAIRARGGMTYREIQRLMLAMNGKDFDPKKHRGWGSTNIQEMHEEFLVRGPDKKYRIISKTEAELRAEDLRRSKSFVARYEAERRRVVREGGVAPPALEKVEKLEVGRWGGEWHATVRTPRHVSLQLKVLPGELREAAGN